MPSKPNPAAFLRRNDLARVASTTRETERAVKLGNRGDPAGPRISGAYGTDRWARAPVGGIAAGASGTITFLLDSATATAKNKWEHSAVPAGSVKCLVGWDEFGDLVVKVWDCPPA